MTPLITGGCGFIGSHLCELHAARGESVMVIDDLSSGKRSNLLSPDAIALTIGDIADKNTVTGLVEQASVIFHLAAIASVTICEQEPERAAHTNVTGTQTIFDAVAEVKRRTGRSIPIIYASSAAVYGDNPNIPLSESAVPAPINRYGEHKLANERIAARAHAEHGVTSIGLRFFNIYGPRQDPSSPYSGVISKFIDGARAGTNLIIFGDGEQTRDFIYVGDIVRMLSNAADFAGTNAGTHLFNVCTGTATNLKQLAQTIGTASGRDSIMIDHKAARMGDIRHSLGDPHGISQAFSVNSWTPLAVGLKETWDADA